MGFLNRIVRAAPIERRVSPENPSTNLSNPASWLIDWFGGAPTPSGQSVSEFSALNNTTVYACVAVIAETIGTIPLIVYERLRDGGKRRAPEHPMYRTLHDEPHPYIASGVLRETLTGHLATWGNGYAEIISRGNRIWLEPRLPDRTYPVLLDSGRVTYFFDKDKTNDPKQIRAIKPEDMLHIPGWGWDGLQGYSRIRMARNAIGLAGALEESGGRLFSNGIRGSGIVTHPGRLRPESARLIAESIQANHAGAGNWHKPMVFEEGMTWTQIGIPPEDAQFLESRAFQVVEIAAMFRMQLHKIQRMDKATFSNIEQQAIEHVTDTIRPYAVRWEQEINRKLFNPADQGRYFAEFNLEGLLRGDIATRYQAYAVGRQWGWLSANDVREKENLNPIEGGDDYMAPMNMTTLDKLGELPEPAPTLGPRPVKEAASLGRPENRSLRTRQRIQGAHARLIEGAARKFVNREVAQTRKAVEKYLKSRASGDFKEWAEKFYRDHASYVDRTIFPVLMTFAEQMAAVASEEVGEEPRDMTSFVRAYSATFATQHAESRLGQILKLMNESEAEDLAALIDARLGEWQESTPEKVATRESANAGSAFARFAWTLAGVTLLRWVAMGDSCPLCQELDGRVVGIERQFVEKDQVVGEGTEKPLEAQHGYRHPPLHNGCNCMIAPG